MSGPEPTSSDSQRIVELWRGRLLAARAQYDLAVTEAKTAGRDFIKGTLPTPDGGTSMGAALKAETRARNEYMRILRIFTDMVVDGKRPAE